MYRIVDIKSLVLQISLVCNSSILKIKKLHLRKVKLLTFLEEKVWIVKKISPFMGIINEIYTCFYYWEGYKLFHQKFDERRSYFKKFLIKFMRWTDFRIKNKLKVKSYGNLNKTLTLITAKRLIQSIQELIYNTKTLFFARLTTKWLMLRVAKYKRYFPHDVNIVWWEVCKANKYCSLISRNAKNMPIGKLNIYIYI